MKSRLLSFSALLVAMACSDTPLASAGSVSGLIGYFTGLFWEDGGLAPPLVVGDELHIVGTFEGEAKFDAMW
jgi:hypothetical protein